MFYGAFFFFKYKRFFKLNFKIQLWRFSFSPNIFILKGTDLKYIFMPLEVCESLALSGSSVLYKDTFIVGVDQI